MLAASVLALMPALRARAEIIPVSVLLRGLERTAAECSALSHAVWIEVFGRSFCMRYYMSNARQYEADPIILLQGDQLGRARLKDKSFIPRDDLKDVDTDIYLRRVDSLAARTKSLTIYFARVGLDGSSGNHIVRRTLLELHATNAAIEAIKERYRFKRLHLVGQSGGATLIAGLLSLRNDIGCAILGSGRLALIDSGQPEEPALRYFDPSDEVVRIAHTSTARIMVISDPADQLVTPAAQTTFVKRLSDVGGRAAQFFVTAIDARRHAVSTYASLAAALCKAGESDEEIREKLARLVAKRLQAVAHANGADGSDTRPERLSQRATESENLEVVK